MNEELQKANIPEEQWPYCYIEEDGKIFTPIYDEEGQMLEDGKARYEVWLERKNLPPEPEIQEEIMAQMLLNQQKLLLGQQEQEEVLAAILLGQQKIKE